MNGTLEHDHANDQSHDTIAQALEIIDANLRTLGQRELVSTVEVSDLLLDVRSLLAATDLTPVASLSAASTG